MKKTSDMHTITNISIPQPCHQDWNNMTPAQQGRHCEVCQKNVIDFTTMASSEIIANLAGGGKTCGRFLPGQLDAVNRQLSRTAKNRLCWKSIAIAAILTGSISTLKAAVKPEVKTEQGPEKALTDKEFAKADTAGYITLKGKVIDADNKLPIVSAWVGYDTRIMLTATDQLGYFSIKIPDTVKMIKIIFVGYQGVNVPVSNFKNGELTKAVTLEPAVLGEVVVVGKVPFYKRWWRGIKNLF